MDFIESLKDIKKQMQEQKPQNKNTKNLTQEKKQKDRAGSEKDDIEAIFLKEEKLRDEFSAFIKECDIKKI